MSLPASNSISTSRSTTEVSIANVYCVVYSLTDGSWVVLDEGWSQVFLFHDATDGSHRLIAWDSKQNLLMNSLITRRSKYRKKSNDFHKFSGTDGTYGFGFYDSPESLADADRFSTSVTQVIVQANDAVVTARSPTRQKTSAITKKSATSTAASSSRTSAEQRTAAKAQGTASSAAASRGGNVGQKTSNVGVYQDGKIPLGKLKVEKPKFSLANVMGRMKKKKKESAPVIGLPYGIIHTQHVSYDAENRTYNGLPSEWKAALSVKFGVPVQQAEVEPVAGYDCPIPCILVQLKEYLLSHGGREEEGVFRVQPDADECSFIKDQLNKGEFKTCDDVNVVANLIKVWFRDLPKKILDLTPQAISDAVDSENASNSMEATMATVTQPNRSIFIWLLDLCLEIAAHEDDNKMNPKALSIVFGPNLWDGRHYFQQDPHAEVRFMAKVALFMQRAMLWRQRIVDRQ